MPKPSKRPTREQRKRLNSTLAQHRKEGRTLKPPFRTLENFRSVPWMKDTFPDMMWLCSIISTNGQLPGLLGCGRVLDIVDDIAGPYIADLDERDKPVFDGRLTNFEKVPEDARVAILDELETRGLYDFAVPEEFAHALGLYPQAPGRWLISRWLESGLSVDWETAQRYLSPVLIEANHGQSQVATDAKAIVLRQFLKAGKISIAPQAATAFELLPRYPNQLTEDELKRVRPTIRAMFLGLLGPERGRDLEDAMTNWARQFWRSNWNLFPCLTEEDSAVPPGDNETTIEEVTAQRVETLDQLRQDFLTSARRADPDLYEPHRYEVLTGIVLRSLRLASAAANTPVLWSGEFGMPVLRSMIESQIILRWLIKRDDTVLYERFKDYGRGRLKLLKLHVEEYADSLGEQAPSELLEYLNYLDAEVNQDIGAEWQDISLGATFSGISAHAMAKEVGLEREYNFQFAPASSATHGEWTSLDRYVLQRCRNPLHRGHRVPRSEEATSVASRFIDLLIDIADDLVSDRGRGGQHPSAFARGDWCGNRGRSDFLVCV